MKSTSKLIMFAFTFLAVAASAYAQSPRDELKQMVEQLQKTPNDNALRERIIKLVQTLRPAPAIPEEAREPFVMGATVLKKASDRAGASKAVDLFTQALTIAPWFADAYYNRALARETAGQFESAIDDLKLYLEFKLTDSERREAQDKIYSLKADAQLASAKKAEQDRIARAEEEKRQAEQAKRDVITKIKNVVSNRAYNYVGKRLSYSGKSEDVFGGVNQNELFGGGTYYMFDEFPTVRVRWYWKFFDERVELWSTNDAGEEYLPIVGESWGPRITDMRWFLGMGRTKSETQVWGYFDLQNGYLYSACMHGDARTRPLNDSEFDRNKRYQYCLYKPAK